MFHTYKKCGERGRMSQDKARDGSGQGYVKIFKNNHFR